MRADEPALGHQPVKPHAPAPRWFTGWRGALGLVLLCLLAQWPGVFSLPPVDRDESRFAQASRQMLESDTLRGWVVPMVGDRPRLNKPPLIYWLQASSAGLLGDPPGSPIGNIWVFRVPSLLCAMATALLTWRLGLSLLAFVGPRAPAAAWTGAALLASCLMVVWDARQARADQLLLTTTTLALFALWKCASVERGRWWILLWVAVGLGVLAKGPITPMIVALTALALGWMRRREGGLWWWWRATKPLIGVAIVVAMALPWVVLVGRSIGWSEYATEVWNETIGRSVSAKEGHWGPPGYHLVLLPVLLWPGSLLTAAGIGLAWRGRRTGEIPGAQGASRFLLAWVVPSWIVFEAVTTKLPHYTLPLYPALALVSAWALVEAIDTGRAALGLARPMARIGFVLWALIGLAVVVGLPVLVWRAVGLEMSVPRMLLFGAMFGSAGGMVLASLRGVWQGRFVLAQGLGVCAMVVGCAALIGLALPRARALWISPGLVSVIERVPGWAERPIGAAGYQEDSLQFLLRGRLERVGKAKAEAWRAEHPDGVLVVPSDLVTDNERDRVLGRVAGFNYSSGDWVDLSVLAPLR